MKKLSLILVITILLTIITIPAVPVYSAELAPLYNINTIAAGENHSLVIKTDNTLWAFGDNYYGQIGNGSSVNCSEPVEIMSNVIFAAAGNNSSYAVTKDGTLYGWGLNDKGQISSDEKYIYNSPVIIMENVSAVSAGEGHLLIIKNDKSLWGMGSNSSGQLGDAKNNEINEPVKIMDNIEYVSAGSDYSLAINTSGNLYGFGDGTSGQFGLTYNATLFYKPALITDNVASAAAGYEHSLVLKKDGSVYVAGKNTFGQLGTINEEEYTLVKTDLTNVSQVFAGYDYSAVIKSDGTLLTWGHNSYGQLHNGNNTDISVPTGVTSGVVSFAAGKYHSLMLKTNKYVSAAGLNASGQLGFDANINTDTPFRLNNTFIDFAAGKSHAVAIDEEGILLTWGNNDNGQLGNGTLTPETKPKRVFLFGETPERVWAGGDITIVKTTDKNYYVCGSNEYGQFGIRSGGGISPDFVKITSLTGLDVTDISIGETHVLAVVNGNIWSWGNNEFGQLGDKTFKSRYFPVMVLIEQYEFVQVSAGKSHSLAIDTYGRVFSWGGNSSGQLGRNTSDGPAKNNTPEIAGGVSKIVQISAGYNHSIALDSSEIIWVWGSNFQGQLNQGTVKSGYPPTKTSEKAISVFAGENYTSYINNDVLSFWGDFDAANGSLATNVAEAVFGEDFIIYRNTNNAIYTIGDNKYGQLGNGKAAFVTTPKSVLSGGLVQSIINVSSVTLSEKSIEIIKGDSAVITATVNPKDAYNPTVEWSSSDKKIATVSGGVVKGISGGTVKITATCGGVSASCTVKVTVPLTGIKLNKTKITLTVGETFRLVPSGVPDGSVLPKVKWSSSNKSSAIVSTKGTVKAKKYGKSTITCKTDDGKYTVTCEVNVTVPRPASVTLTSGENSAKISWEQSADADGYEVVISNTKNGTYKILAKLSNRKTTITHKNLKTGKKYFYKVRAYKIVKGEKIYTALTDSVMYAADDVMLLNY